MERALLDNVKVAIVTDIVADELWTAAGWVWEDLAVSVVAALQAAFPWRSTTWWENRRAREMAEAPLNFIWKHLWNCMGRGG